jgi:hypothetical protein
MLYVGMRDAVLSKLVRAGGKGFHYNIIVCKDRHEALAIVDIAKGLRRMKNIVIKETPPPWYHRNVEERKIYYYSRCPTRGKWRKQDYHVLTSEEVNKYWLKRR